MEAATKLRDPEIPALFVTDEGDGLVGVVCESDIVASVAEGGDNPPVEAYMSTGLVTVSPQTPVGLAADRMRDSRVSVLPVVDGGVEGFVTVQALAPYISRHRLEFTWDGERLTLPESQSRS